MLVSSSLLIAQNMAEYGGVAGVLVGLFDQVGNAMSAQLAQMTPLRWTLLVAVLAGAWMLLFRRR